MVQLEHLRRKSQAILEAYRIVENEIDHQTQDAVAGTASCLCRNLRAYFVQTAQVAHAGRFQSSDDIGPKMQAVIPLAARSANHQ